MVNDVIPASLSQTADSVARRAREIRDGLALLAGLLEPVPQEANGAMAELLMRIETTPALGPLALDIRLCLARLGCINLAHLALLTDEDIQGLALDCTSDNIIREGAGRATSLLRMIDKAVLERMPVMGVIRSALHKIACTDTNDSQCPPTSPQYNDFLELAEQAASEYREMEADCNNVERLIVGDCTMLTHPTPIDMQSVAKPEPLREPVTYVTGEPSAEVFMQEKVDAKPSQPSSAGTPRESDIAPSAADAEFGSWQDKSHLERTALLVQMWEQQPPKTSDFNLVGELGEGSFGLVTLELHRQSNVAFALKRVSKTRIVNMGLQKKERNERAILREVASCSCIVSLYATIKDTMDVIYVLEPCLGGELVQAYANHSFFGSSLHARFYGACVISALDFLHRQKIVYRDLKPQNLLLCRSGYAKLIDMGIAKRVTRLTYTTCGSAAYFAPERILQQGYGLAVDWWALGILIYELMTGINPFESSEPAQTYRMIMKGIVEVSFLNFPIEIEDLIRRLCARDPRSRLPMGVEGLAKLTSHMWFRDFGWQAFREQTMVPPFLPNVRNDRDLQNFAELGKSQPDETYQDIATDCDKDS